MKNELVWQVGYTNSPRVAPAEYFPATVPGAVQLDYAAAHDLPDYNYEMNYEQYQWMQEKYWVYRGEYDATYVKSRKLFFVTEGIDFRYDIYVNSHKMLSYEGMYRKSVVDVSEFIGRKFVVQIMVHPMPKSNVGNTCPNTRTDANQTTKPAVSYGWDFHPRLVPLGIWNDTYILATDYPEIIKPEVTYQLNANRSVASVSFSVNADNIVGWTLTDPFGKVVFKGANPFEAFEVRNPYLWWCNGYGDPNLYTWQLVVSDMGKNVTYSGKIGFKTVSLEMNEGTWEVLEFPKPRSCPPITLCLNGVNVFVKGSNWVAPEIFYGTIDRARYSEQLELVRAANLNFLRCWGGAIVNKEAFFEICDEQGIMVWQEFPLGCNNYYSTDAYLDLLKREAIDIIERLSKHACHAIWCGGNELFNAWSGMTDQSIALRTLNSLTLEKTPNIPFLPTSPIMGMAHGGYTFLDFDGKEVIEVFQNSKNTAYTEFGVSSLSSLDCLMKVSEPDKLFPLENNELTRAHHAFKAWCLEDTWCSVDTIQKYFGESSSLEELVERGQYLQSIGYRFIFEEARRQKPYCSMAVNWCFNEPWATIANNSLVCYPNTIKPAFYEVAEACRGVATSARFKKLKYKSGEVLDFEVWMLNDGVETIDPETVRIMVKVGDGEAVHQLDWRFPELEANTNLQGPTIYYKLPEDLNAKELSIILSCAEYSSEYKLLYECEIKEEKKEILLNI